ncbi:EF-hand domain-containing protein [Phenylobacterium sp.]|jgi:hypothetical protein|uniref:EF-hand domain-containing protein n=1 Tax=Phenylobacterium sp. TaxID=1871053 RepID=UPI002F42983F
MRRTLTIALAAGSLFAAAAVDRTLAQPRPGSPEAAGFTQLFISPAGEPYRAKPGEPYPVVVWFKQADANHDGVITKEEFRADHAGFFYALDNDDAGFLDGTKIAFYENRVLPDVYKPDRIGLNVAPPDGRAHLERAVSAGGRDGALLIPVQVLEGPTPEGSHPQEDRRYGVGGAQGPAPDLNAQRRPRRELVGAARYGLLGEAEPIVDADTNLDGRVTKAEFLAAADRRFKELDKRHDGKLTLDELPQTPVQIELARNSRSR